MYDSRLLGTWRSDARRTVREIRARRDIPVKRARQLAALFGRLELRFTRTRCYSRLNGHVESRAYKVVAKDSSGVVTVAQDDVLGQSSISHIHFVDKHFWINVGTGVFREFFRRVHR
jgi:hypothetical protein